MSKGPMFKCSRKWLLQDQAQNQFMQRRASSLWLWLAEIRVYLGLAGSKWEGRPGLKSYCKITTNNVNYLVLTFPDLVVMLNDHSQCFQWELVPSRQAHSVPSTACPNPSLAQHSANVSSPLAHEEIPCILTFALKCLIAIVITPNPSIMQKLLLFV